MALRGEQAFEASFNDYDLVGPQLGIFAWFGIATIHFPLETTTTLRKKMSGMDSKFLDIIIRT